MKIIVLFIGREAERELFVTEGARVRVELWLTASEATAIVRICLIYT